MKIDLGSGVTFHANLLPLILLFSVYNKGKQIGSLVFVSVGNIGLQPEIIFPVNQSLCQ